MKKGFTLAEVLITLGIIGVVAAMTLPSLITSYREKQIVIRLKKTVSVLQNSFNYSRSDNNVNLADTFAVYEGGMYDKNFQEDFASYFTKNLITNKSCGNTCFADKVKNIDKSTIAISYPYQPTSYKSVQLNDGTTLLFRAISSNCSLVYENYWNICGFLYIDVDGKQNGSTLGRDTFLFYVKNYSGLIPAGVSTDENAMTSCYSSGSLCTNWLMINENMDYLHCKDLSWNGKTKCK